MSASTERKNRIAAREAGTDKKTNAALEEARKKAQSKRRWTWGTIGVIILIAAILILNSSLLYTSTTALTVGGEKYSPAEANFYYGTEYMNMASYLSYFGVDTSSGMSGLGKQECPWTDGGTWRDYFRDMAKSEIQRVRALVNYANENGIVLTEEEIAEIDANFDGMDAMAKAYGYSGADALYSMNYGTGVTQKIVRQAAIDAKLAEKAEEQMRESLTWTDEELEEYYAGLNGDKDLFDYSIYYVSAETIEQTVTGENGEETTEMTADEQTRAEAKATADAIVMGYKDGADIEDLTERFEVAVEHETGDVPTARENSTGASIPAEYAEWLKGARQAGDIEVFADAETDPAGYTVVLFLSRNDNHYATANVRHILIKAEADADGNYTDEAKAAAKTRVEEILAEYEAGDKTEESFAALAEQYSEDEGSNTNGGLYENIYHNQMVPEFNDFCFGGHQPGDVAIVYGESGAYAGYHLVYYVGEGPLYSTYLAKTEKQTEAVNEWQSGLIDACEVKEGFGFRLIGK